MCAETAAVSVCSVYTIQPCTMSLRAKPHMCLAVTCHLHCMHARGNSTGSSPGNSHSYFNLNLPLFLPIFLSPMHHPANMKFPTQETQVAPTSPVTKHTQNSCGYLAPILSQSSEFHQDIYFLCVRESKCPGGPWVCTCTHPSNIHVVCGIFYYFLNDDLLKATFSKKNML